MSVQRVARRGHAGGGAAGGGESGEEGTSDSSPLPFIGPLLLYYGNRKWLTLRRRKATHLPSALTQWNRSTAPAAPRSPEIGGQPTICAAGGLVYSEQAPRQRMQSERERRELTRSRVERRAVPHGGWRISGAGGTMDHAPVKTSFKASLYLPLRTKAPQFSGRRTPATTSRARTPPTGRRALELCGTRV